MRILFMWDQYLVMNLGIKGQSQLDGGRLRYDSCGGHGDQVIGLFNLSFEVAMTLVSGNAMNVAFTR